MAAGRNIVLGSAAGAGVFLLLLAVEASPQTIGVASPLFRIPFTVDSEVIDYEPDGTSKVDITYTSYIDNGREIILSSTMPGHPLVTAVRRVLEFGSFLWQQIARRPVTSTDPGCMYGSPVRERATILGYETVAMESRGPRDKQRVIFWMAPELRCFALKLRTEELQPDGSWRVVGEKRALSVTRAGVP
jgi:hypothetical protein